MATGNIIYYKMAANLLASFRLHNPGVPFAIVCDRANEYTDMFDDVVVLKKANGNYMDKFSLLIKSPYDESIFIEPDCLIYRNLDFFWGLLSHESDCSSFGWNEGGLEPWFKTQETRSRLFQIVPELSEDAIVPLFNPGYIFIRKGLKCQIPECFRRALCGDGRKNASHVQLSYPKPAWCFGSRFHCLNRLPL